MNILYLEENSLRRKRKDEDIKHNCNEYLKIQYNFIKTICGSLLQF